MTTPSFYDIAVLISTGEVYTRSNESYTRVAEDTVWAYCFNYRGVRMYYFHTIEHLIMFFHGTDESKAEALSKCKIERYRTSGCETDEKWIVEQEGITPTLYIAYGAEESRDVAYGRKHIHECTKLEFATEAERAAYIQGIEDGDGWGGCTYELAEEITPPQPEEEEEEEDIYKDVEAELMNIYKNMGIDRPSTHDKILTYCVSDIEDTDEGDVNDQSVATAFRRYLESAG